MSLEPRILCSDDSYRLATWQNVGITDVAGDIDVPRMQHMARMYRDLIRVYPSGIVTLAVIRESTPVASRPARDEAAKFIQELGESIVRMAMVIEAQGIMAQALRTVIRGLNVVTRNTKLVMFKDTEEAIRSLSGMVVPARPGSNVAADLATVLATVRRDYKPGSASRAAQR